MHEPGVYNYFLQKEGRVKYLAVGDQFHMPGQGDFIFKETRVTERGTEVLAYGGKWVTRRPHPKKKGVMVWVSKGTRAGRIPLARSFTLEQMQNVTKYREVS